ncbi:MAG TPA: hypothetical protein VEP69_01590 [Thermodesulfovibrionales bacterium]|nr:hypothetical protein [Thermodesulfovibrionales bacterium]
MPDDEIAVLQKSTAGWDTGDRVAFWAEQFIGIPYDADPLGDYVRRNVIVADEHVDCMYLTFRTVELALGRDPEDSVALALDKRFPGKGIVENGKVRNYTARFRYGEDMIESGKWGREITTELGDHASVVGSRGRSHVCMIPKQGVPATLSRLRKSDIVCFVKAPGKRKYREIIGHIGIIKREDETVYLISAFGQKNKGGMVKKVLFSEYSAEMPFVGIKVTRLD